MNVFSGPFARSTGARGAVHPPVPVYSPASGTKPLRPSIPARQPSPLVLVQIARFEAVSDAVILVNVADVDWLE